MSLPFGSLKSCSTLTNTVFLKLSLCEIQYRAHPGSDTALTLFMVILTLSREQTLLFSLFRGKRERPYCSCINSQNSSPPRTALVFRCYYPPASLCDSAISYINTPARAGPHYGQEEPLGQRPWGLIKLHVPAAQHSARHTVGFHHCGLSE